MDLSFNVKEDQYELAVKFHQEYDLVNAFIPANSNKETLRPKLQRQCRFCGKSMPDVKFNFEAHVIPELLGNKALLSDFECDECNQLFSEYEDQFAKMLEPYRTLHAVQGKGNKVPTFKSPKAAIRMQVGDFYENKAVHLTRTEFENDDISFDTQKGIMKIRFKKHPYTLRKVYKLFIKLALSIIPEDEIHQDYQLAKQYILNTLKGNLSGCMVVSYILQFPTNFQTHLLLFKKRDAAAKIFTHVVVLYTMNFVFAFPVTLNKQDLPLYGEEIAPFDFPLMTLYNMDYEKVQVHKNLEDFSFDEPVIGKEDEMSFTMDKEDLKHITGLNMETGEQVSVKENGPIAKIILGTGPELKIDKSKIPNRQKD